MEKLSATPVVSEYVANMNQKVKLGSRIVTVRSYRNYGRQGSYDRGLKFTENEYGYLVWSPSGGGRYDTRYSPDHGKTWYDMCAQAQKQRGGKVRLNSSKREEFAFDSVQLFNRAYYGADYQWHP